MLLNPASDESREPFGLARKLHSIVLPVGLACLLLAWCAGHAMGGSADGIDAAKITPAQFQLVSVSGTKPFAASPEDLSKKGYVEEEYYDRFPTATAASPVGRFRTARPPDSRETVRIAVFS